MHEERKVLIEYLLLWCDLQMSYIEVKLRKIGKENKELGQERERLLEDHRCVCVISMSMNMRALLYFITDYGFCT